MHMRERLSLALTVVLVGLLPVVTGTRAVQAAGLTYTVAVGGTATCSSGQQVGASFGSIQGALDCAAQDNPPAAGPDTITIAQGAYGELLTISANVTLIGSGDATINGGNSGTVVTVNGGYNVGMRNLTITGGTASADSGGGINNSGTLTLSNSTVAGNAATCSGVCKAAGGGISNSGTLTLNNSTVTENTIPCPSDTCLAFGGGISNLGTLTLSNSAVTGNTISCSEFFGCNADGGGIFTQSGTLTLNDSSVKANTASCSGRGCGADGGGIYGNFVTLALSNSSVKGNTASCPKPYCSAHGGGIATFGSSVTLTDSMVSKNIPDNCYPTNTITGCKG
jgi:hypothetical protein